MKIKQASGNNKKLPMRVLIGTPSLDGRVDAWYAFACHELSKLALINNIETNISMLSYESILPMARNQLLTMAIENEYDALLFVDSDTFFNPLHIIDILKDNRDVIALSVPNKSDDEAYNVNYDLNKTSVDSYIKVESVGTGCVKLSKKVLKKLADNSKETIFRGKKLKNICQYDFNNEAFVGEDINLCRKIHELGFDIWVATDTTCMHIGTKIYQGNFKEYLTKIQNQK
jgi:hypothetical protein